MDAWNHVGVEFFWVEGGFHVRHGRLVNAGGSVACLWRDEGDWSGPEFVPVGELHTTREAAVGAMLACHRAAQGKPS